MGKSACRKTLLAAANCTNVGTLVELFRGQNDLDGGSHNRQKCIVILDLGTVSCKSERMGFDVKCVFRLLCSTRLLCFERREGVT